MNYPRAQQPNGKTRSAGSSGKTAPEPTGPSARTPSQAAEEAEQKQAMGLRLLESCAQGDELAFSRLHNLFAARILRWIRRFVRTPEEAEEILQEVFLYVWRRADRYDPHRASVATWLIQIARSRAIDHLRRKGTREKTLTVVAREAPSELEPRAEQQVFGHELRQQLGAALETLPEAQRDALILAYFGDMTQVEIAQQQHIPLGTVKTRTSLGIRKLRAQLADSALAR